MHSIWRLGAVAALALWGAAAGAADVTVGGQVRPRWELRDTDGAAADGHTAMRVRAHLAAALGQGVDAFVQWQDVRTWGEEGSTLGDFSADQLDLHQGYVDVEDLAGVGADLRLGRQEISFGGQRLVGAVGWTHQGRAFDAARVTLEPAGSSIDLVAARLGDTSAPSAPGNGSLLAVYASLAPLDGTELFLLRNTMSGGTEQHTAGLRRAARAGDFDYRVEGAWQTGERGGLDVAAFFAAARVGRDVGAAHVALWYDYLSGDDDGAADGETKVFDTLFATNHKFYGYADLFLNLPVHTAGRGLQDVALKASTSPAPGWTLSAAAHAFRVAADAGLDSGRLGEELDLTCGYDLRGVAQLSGGASWVRAGDGFADIGRPMADQLFLWAMMDTRF